MMQRTLFVAYPPVPESASSWEHGRRCCFLLMIFRLFPSMMESKSSSSSSEEEVGMKSAVLE